MVYGCYGQNNYKKKKKKAYDQVKWPFLEAMMRTMGFEERWIHLVMTSVKSVSYSVLINGQRGCNILHKNITLYIKILSY